MKTLAFVHGWAEGSWQSSQLAGELRKNGFVTNANPEQAEIILAHSAGCFLVPAKNRAKLIILIGVPFWPGKPILRSLLEKLKLEAAEHQKRQDLKWFASKLAHNIFYILSKPGQLRNFLANRKNLQLPDKRSQQVILIRNQNDRFCTPQIRQLLPATKNYGYIEIAGLHDDCWINPKPYVEIIKKYANKLA